MRVPSRPVAVVLWGLDWTGLEAERGIALRGRVDRVCVVPQVSCAEHSGAGYGQNCPRREIERESEMVSEMVQHNTASQHSTIIHS